MSSSASRKLSAETLGHPDVVALLTLGRAVGEVPAEAVRRSSEDAGITPQQLRSLVELLSQEGIAVAVPAETAAAPARKKVAAAGSATAKKVSTAAAATAPAKKAPAKKAPAKKAPAKKAPAKKAPAKAVGPAKVTGPAKAVGPAKTPAKGVPAKKAPAKKAPAKKAPAAVKTEPSTKTEARNAPPPAKKAPVKKAPAKKTPNKRIT